MVDAKPCNQDQDQQQDKEFYEYNYEKEFCDIMIKSSEFTNEQKNQLTYMKLLLVKRLQLELEYKRKYQEILKKYEVKFKPNYDIRNKIITGEELPETTYPFYEKYSIEPIIKSPDEKGIPEFWLRCIQNSGTFTPILSEQDDEVLANLIKLTCETKEGGDYTLTFTFEKKWILMNDELKLEFIFDKRRLTIKEIKATEPIWGNDEVNPQYRRHTHKPGERHFRIRGTGLSRVRGGRGDTGKSLSLRKDIDESKLYYTYEPRWSFFNIFRSFPNPNKDKILEEGADEEIWDNDIHNAEEIGRHIKEDLIPNSIEYYFDLYRDMREGKIYNGYDPYAYYDEDEWNYLNGVSNDDY